MVIAAPVVLMLSMLGQAVMTVVFGQPAPTLAHETLAALADDTQPLLWRGVMIGAVVLGAPIVEEVVYRGFLQTSLTKLTGRPWLAIVITTLVFVLMHAGAVPVEGWLPAALVLTTMSIAMSVAFARTGRLTTPIVLHVLYNAANVGVALVMV
jgi:membrane protease YdiL (CAAX protease family)